MDEPLISAGGGQQQDDGDDDDDDEGAQEHIDFEAKFKWLGPICRTSAQFPPHCLHLPCLREMTQSIRTRYENMQITGLEATPSQPPHDDPAFQDRARQMRSEFDNANPNTTKTYKQLGTLFLIYCFFFSESFDPMQPLFTRLHAGLFLNKFIHRPKQLRSRGAIGNTITTKSMIARLSMVLNGFFKYEREITGAILRARELAPGAAGFFDGEIEVTKPCSKNNPLWRAANRVHTVLLRRAIEKSTFVNHANLKMHSRVTDNELHRMALTMLNSDNLVDLRDAAVLLCTRASMARTGDICNAELKDISHYSFTTEYDPVVQRPGINFAKDPADTYHLTNICVRESKSMSRAEGQQSTVERYTVPNTRNPIFDPNAVLFLLLLERWEDQRWEWGTFEWLRYPLFPAFGSSSGDDRHAHVKPQQIRNGLKRAAAKNGIEEGRLECTEVGHRARGAGRNAGKLNGASDKGLNRTGCWSEPTRSRSEKPASTGSKHYEEAPCCDTFSCVVGFSLRKRERHFKPHFHNFPDFMQPYSFSHGGKTYTREQVLDSLGGSMLQSLRSALREYLQMGSGHVVFHRKRTLEMALEWVLYKTYCAAHCLPALQQVTPQSTRWTRGPFESELWKAWCDHVISVERSSFEGLPPHVPTPEIFQPLALQVQALTTQVQALTNLVHTLSTVTSTTLATVQHSQASQIALQTAGPANSLVVLALPAHS